MPTIDSSGCSLNVDVQGAAGAPVLMLSNSLCTNLGMWAPQMPQFTRHFRVVRYDSRGHGRSGAPDGAYTIEMLGRDALAIMDGLGLDKVHWCGLSMGGMVGMWLATYAPERIGRLVLSNTAAQMRAPDVWNKRIEAARRGMAGLVEATIERWFTPGFLARANEAVEPVREMIRTTPAEGFIGCCAAIRDMDQAESIRRIGAATLIIAGEHDRSTTLEAARFMQERIAGSQVVALDAAHLSNIEQAGAYTEAVLRHLRGEA